MPKGEGDVAIGAESSDIKGTLVVHSRGIERREHILDAETATRPDLEGAAESSGAEF